MKSEVLSHLVLRLVVGSFMLVHAIYSLVMYDVYVIKLKYYLNSLGLMDIELITKTAPLFPFVEVVISVLLLTGLWLRKSFLLSFMLIIFQATIHFLLGNIAMLSIIAFVLGALVVFNRILNKSSNHKVLDNFKNYKTMN